MRRSRSTNERSNAGKRPNVYGRSAFAQVLDRHIVWRIPEGVDGLHVGKLEHENRTRVMLAFEDFHLRAPRHQFSAKAGDKGNDRLAIRLILRLVGDGGLDDKISRHDPLSREYIYTKIPPRGQSR